MLTGVGLAAWLALPAQAAIVASVKPVGFIAAAIAEGVTLWKSCCRTEHLNMIMP